MAQIPVELPDPLASFVDSQIVIGRYPNVSDYVSDLVRADLQQQQFLEQLAENAELSKKLEQGLTSGEGRRWTADVLQELRNQVLDRDCQSRGDR